MRLTLLLLTFLRRDSMFIRDDNVFFSGGNCRRYKRSLHSLLAISTKVFSFCADLQIKSLHKHLPSLLALLVTFRSNTLVVRSQVQSEVAGNRQELCYISL